MPKTEVIIIEDEFFVADHLNDLVDSLGYQVVGIYHSGEDFLAETDWQFDAAIVDIFLSEELDGLQVAEQLKIRNKPFIFLTANEDTETLKNAARLEPKAYLTKPFKTRDVEASLAIINHLIPAKLEIIGANGKEYINPSDILFVKANGAYIEIILSNRSITQRKTIKDIINLLPDNFSRIHRSYLVNNDFIVQRQSNQIIIKGHCLPISRYYKENLP